MMKKIGFVSLLLILTAALIFPVSAKLFTDMDSYSSFTDGGNPVFNDGDTVGDYWVGEWDGGEILDGAKIATAPNKGWNGTSAIALWEEDATENQGMYLFVSASNAISKDYSGEKYLRVWMDLSDVAFRKANFGVTDSKYNLFTTDEENSQAADWPLYYLPEGGSNWETYYHGGDGCFGDAQDSDVKGFKGFFAFPVSDFVIRDNAANKDGLEKDTAANMGDVSGVYLFWDYSDDYADLQNNKFYLDNIEFVSDYKIFDDPLYNPPVEEPVETAEEPSVAVEAVAESTPVSIPAEVQTPVAVPQTGSDTMLLIAILFLSATIITVKTKVNRRSY